MILETSFLIDLLKNKRNAVNKMKSLVESGELFGIASPTIFELWTGFYALDKTENEKTKTKSIMDNMIVHPLDNKSASIAGRINGELIKKGSTIDPEDSMIAGIAISNNKTVLTRDPHFNRIEGLKVENY